jgi:hypothetical protein
MAAFRPKQQHPTVTNRYRYVSPYFCCIQTHVDNKKNTITFCHCLSFRLQASGMGLFYSCWLYSDSCWQLKKHLHFVSTFSIASWLPFFSSTKKHNLWIFVRKRWEQTSNRCILVQEFERLVFAVEEKKTVITQMLSFFLLLPFPQ